MDQLIDRANEISSELMEEINHTNPKIATNELNMLTFVGVNLLSSAAVNRAMAEVNHDPDKALEVLPHVLESFKTSLYNLCLEHVSEIKAGKIQKIEVKANGNVPTAH